MNTATLDVSQTRSLPRSRSPVMTASTTESCTMTRETGATTRSPARASRPDARLKIFSARVLPRCSVTLVSIASRDHPLAQQRIQLIHRERPRVGERLDPPRDLLELVLTELEAELLGAVVDRVLPGQAVRHIDRARETEVRWIEDRVAVRDRAAGVVVAVELDVAGDVVPQLHRERVAPAGRGDADGVGDTDPVHAHPVDRGVNLEEVALGRAEAVLGREADLLGVVADERDDLGGVGDDLVDALSVAELPQVRRRSEQDVDAVDAGLDRDARVVHVAADVRKHLRAER